MIQILKFRPVSSLHMGGYVNIPKQHRDSDVPAPEISIADKTAAHITTATHFIHVYSIYHQFKNTYATGTRR